MQAPLRTWHGCVIRATTKPETQENHHLLGPEPGARWLASHGQTPSQQHQLSEGHSISRSPKQVTPTHGPAGKRKDTRPPTRTATFSGTVPVFTAVGDRTCPLCPGLLSLAFPSDTLCLVGGTPNDKTSKHGRWRKPCSARPAPQLPTGSHRRQQEADPARSPGHLDGAVSEEACGTATSSQPLKEVETADRPLWAEGAIGKGAGPGGRCTCAPALSPPLSLPLHA